MFDFDNRTSAFLCILLSGSALVSSLNSECFWLTLLRTGSAYALLFGVSWLTWGIVVMLLLVNKPHVSALILASCALSFFLVLLMPYFFFRCNPSSSSF
jgi:hypothetical protein